MTADVLTAVELSRLMIHKSSEVDAALVEYRRQNEAWVEAERRMRMARAQSYVTAKAKTVDERKALVDIACDEETYEAERLDALRNGAKEALRARLSQLSAMQSLAAAAREEMRLARTGPEVAA